ncbi:hypothetical protein ACR77J_01405 [Tissierella praeacuta]
MYVQPKIISFDVDQKLTSFGRDNIKAISLPFIKPIEVNTIPLINKNIVKIVALTDFLIDFK